jgi:hypothetical protein
MNPARSTLSAAQEDLAHGQIVIVTARWILVLAGLVLALWNSDSLGQLRLQIFFILALAFANFYLHAQILMRKPAIGHLIFAASAADVTVISVNVLASGGFASQTFAFYFPALLVLSVAFPLHLTFLYTAATVGFYGLVGLVGVALNEADLQAVVIRCLMLTAVATCGSLYLRLEARRRKEAIPGTAELIVHPSAEKPVGRKATRARRSSTDRAVR